MRITQSGNQPGTENIQPKNGSHSHRTSAESTSDSAKVSKAGGHASGTNEARRTPPHHSEKSEISHRGKEFANAKAIATSTPDVREDRIADLKNRIAAGKYKIDSDKIADRMVDEHIGHLKNER